MYMKVMRAEEWNAVNLTLLENSSNKRLFIGIYSLFGPHISRAMIAESGKMTKRWGSGNRMNLWRLDSKTKVRVWFQYKMQNDE